MAYKPNTIYHIYNQGNNKMQIFYKEKNYLLFINKMRKHLIPYVDIIAYCLMPNHFHFLILTKEEACKDVLSKTTGEPNNCQQILSREIGLLTSHYTKAINKQEDRSGALFKARTKCKECWVDGFITIEDQEKLDYVGTCFDYIHNNPVKAKLVTTTTEWQYSSARDYAKLRNGTLCNQELAKELGII